MNIHIVWAQGWSAAPAKALANSETWRDANHTVHHWDADNCRDFVNPQLLQRAKTSHPAMVADLVLMSAIMRYGGLAAGADMRLLRPDALTELEQKLTKSNTPRGFHVWQAYRRRPYSGGCYFPENHPWPVVMMAGFLRDFLYKKPTKLAFNAFNFTGPGAWVRRLKESPGFLAKNSQQLKGTEFFQREPNDRNRRTPNAVIDPGCYGSWTNNPAESF